MSGTISLNELIEETRAAFAFLCEDLGFTFSREREPSSCEHVAEVLRWVSDLRKRSVAIWLVPLEEDYTHCVTALMRHHQDGAPRWHDNVNFIGLQRMLAHYGIPDRDLPMTRPALLENLRFYARTLREHPETLDSSRWFDRKRMLENERKLYTMDWDRNRNVWLDQLTEKIVELMVEERDVVATNVNDHAPWDLCGQLVEVRATSDELIVRVGPGEIPAADFRESTYSVTVVSPAGEARRELGTVARDEILDAVAEEIGRARRRGWVR